MRGRELVDPVFDGPGHDPHVQVPELLGLTLDEARQATIPSGYIGIRVVDLDSDAEEAWTFDFHPTRLNLATAQGKIVRAALF